jgi:hypothetical protein
MPQSARVHTHFEPFKTKFIKGSMLLVCCMHLRLFSGGTHVYFLLVLLACNPFSPPLYYAPYINNNQALVQIFFFILIIFLKKLDTFLSAMTHVDEVTWLGAMTYSAKVGWC